MCQIITSLVATRKSKERVEAQVFPDFLHNRNWKSQKRHPTSPFEDATTTGATNSATSLDLQPFLQKYICDKKRRKLY
jgi:hypothetical protein